MWRGYYRRGVATFEAGKPLEFVNGTARETSTLRPIAAFADGAAGHFAIGGGGGGCSW